MKPHAAFILDKKKATLIGLTAILLWSFMIGLIRSVSNALGPIGGAATIYTISTLIVFASSGLPKVKKLPRNYLYLAGSFFVLYEILLSLSLGFAKNDRQSIDVAMLNYLWPSITIFFCWIFTKQRNNILIFPGIIIAFLGVCKVLGGENGLDLDEIIFNIKDNPLSYSMAFAASLIWAAYCIATIKYSEGQSGVSLFLMVTAIVLWIKFALGDNPPMHIDLRVAIMVLVASFAVGYGYYAWSIGIVHGNMTVLVAASYFMPVIASASAAVLLGVPLLGVFWQGAFMVCIGSILCWISTVNRSA